MLQHTKVVNLIRYLLKTIVENWACKKSKVSP